MDLQSSEGATGWRVCLYVAHVEGLSSLPHKHPYRATVKVLAFQHLASPRVSSQKESKMEAKMSFLTWKSWMAVPAILLYCGSTGQPYSVWEGTTRECEFQETWFTGGFLGDWLFTFWPPKICISLTWRTKCTPSQTPLPHTHTRAHTHPPLIPVQRPTLCVGELGDTYLNRFWKC